MCNQKTNPYSIGIWIELILFISNLKKLFFRDNLLSYCRSITWALFLKKFAKAMIFKGNYILVGSKRYK